MAQIIGYVYSFIFITKYYWLNFKNILNIIYV